VTTYWLCELDSTCLGASTPHTTSIALQQITLNLVRAFAVPARAGYTPACPPRTSPRPGWSNACPSVAPARAKASNSAGPWFYAAGDSCQQHEHGLHASPRYLGAARVTPARVCLLAQLREQNRRRFDAREGQN